MFHQKKTLLQLFYDKDILSSAAFKMQTSFGPWFDLYGLYTYVTLLFHHDHRQEGSCFNTLYAWASQLSLRAIEQKDHTIQQYNVHR